VPRAAADDDGADAAPGPEDVRDDPHQRVGADDGPAGELDDDVAARAVRITEERDLAGAAADAGAIGRAARSHPVDERSQPHPQPEVRGQRRRQIFRLDAEIPVADVSLVNSCWRDRRAASVGTAKAMPVATPWSVRI
jgi:hypothetical protein